MAYAQPQRSIDRPIVVPTPTNNYPNSFYSPETGHCTGFAVDLLDAVARVSGLRLNRLEQPNQDNRAQILAGEVDLLPSYSYDPSRESYVDFSASYLVMPGTIFAHKKHAGIKTFGELKSSKFIIVGRGSIGERFLRDHDLNVEIAYARSGEEALEMLNSGEHDYLFLSRLTAIPAIERAHLQNVRALDLPIIGYDIRMCFAVRKGDAPLLQRVNEGLAILHRTGEFERLYDRWYGHFEPKRFTLQEVTTYAAGALALALVIALWALIRQRQLRTTLTRQAAQLEESNAVLADAQAVAQLGHWSRSADTKGLVTWSVEVYHIFERDPIQPPPQTVDELVAYAIAADREPWRRAIEEAISRGIEYSVDITLAPTPGLSKIIHVRGRQVRDASGKVTGIFGTVQDVTKWRAVQVAFTRSEQLLRALFDNLPYALGVVERFPDGWRVRKLNALARRLLGVEAESAQLSAQELGFSSERSSFWVELLDRTIDAGGPVFSERKNLELQRDFYVTCVPLNDVPGYPQCCVFIEDITDRKHKDAEIAQSRRLRAVGELVGGIAHEFNNLLTPILLKTEMMKTDWSYLPALLTELQIVTDAAQRSANLTRRLLAFGRKTDLQPETFALAVVVQANVDLVRQTIDRRIQLHLDLPSDLPALFLRIGDVHQIVLNLLLNARDTLDEKLARHPASDWSAAISLTATTLPATAVSPLLPAPPNAATSWIKLTVRDNGMGISSTSLERVFEPFYTTKEVGRGTGLGLATVWHMVAEMGGRIDVESEPGAGTAFHVCLPVYGTSLAQPTETTESARKLEPAARSLHFLVVEDEDIISRLVTSILKRLGHTCRVAPAGPAACEMLAAAPASFDAVLTDLNLPGMSGVEFVQYARALPYSRPIIVVSGRVTEKDRVALAQCGVATIINKPFTLELLLAAIQAQPFDEPR